MIKFSLNEDAKEFVAAQQMHRRQMEGHFCPTFSFFDHLKPNLPYYPEFVKLQPSNLSTTLSSSPFALCPAIPTHPLTALNPISGMIESEGLNGGFGGGHQQPPGEAAGTRIVVEVARGHGCPAQMVLLCSCTSARLPRLLRYGGKRSELWGVSWGFCNVLSVCSRSKLEHILKSPPSAEQEWPHKLVQNGIALSIHTLTYLTTAYFQRG